MADIDPDAVCRCGHVYEVHVGRLGVPGSSCTEIVAIDERQCLCTEFDVDEEVGPCGAWR